MVTSLYDLFNILTTMNSRTKFSIYQLFCFLMISYLSFAQSKFDSILKDPKRGITHKLKLKFSDTLGNNTTLPVLIIKGKERGEVFTILAGVHGAEYAPIIATQELIRELKLEELTGTIIILPITNIGSFYTKTPYINPLDNKNINRIFPGKKDGTVSEKIVNFISSELIPISDIFLDVHSGDASEDLLPFVCYYDNKKFPKQTDITKELSEYSGFENVVSYSYTIKEDEPAQYAFKQACQAGKIALSFESGKLGYLQPEAVKRIKQGFYRIFKKLEMYNFKNSIGKVKFQRLDRQIYIDSPAKGIFYSKFKAGSKVLKGEIIGHITDEFGETIKKIASPKTGVILYMKGTPPTKNGSRLFCISSYKS